MSGEQSDISELKNQRESSKKVDNVEAVSTNSAEKVSDLEDSKVIEKDTNDKINSEVDHKSEKENKNRLTKKRPLKRAAENTETKDIEDNKEDLKEKRKGWWSLKG